MHKLLLIDGNSLAYRAFFGTYRPGRDVLRSSAGVPVNALFTMNQMLTKAIDTYKPTHILVAFDAGKKTQRHDKLPTYKAGRAKTPDDLIQQFPLIKQMLTKMKIKYFEFEGIEADDIIGSVAMKYHNKHQILVFSSDKDLYQLCSPNTTIIVPQNGNRKDRLIIFGEFKQSFGYLPHQVPDIKGLAGDSSDNLPGVVGVGPMGATKLISQYKTLENIFANIELIKGSLKEKLIKNQSMALLCKEIATIFYDVEIPYGFDELEYQANIDDDFISFLEKYELHLLVKKFKNIQKFTKKNNQLSFDNLIF